MISKILKEFQLKRSLTDKELALFVKSTDPTVREAAKKLDTLKRSHASSVPVPNSGTCPAAYPTLVGGRCLTRAAAVEFKKVEDELAKLLYEVEDGVIVTESEATDLAEIAKDLEEEEIKKRGLPISDPEGGVHGHGLIRAQNTTLDDGRHLHIFVDEDGNFFVSEEDGNHPHDVPDGKNRTKKGGPHRHEFRVNGQSFFSEIGGDHDHDLLVFTTGFDGTHQHKIKINGKTFTTLSPAEFVKLHPEFLDAPPIEVGTATEIMKRIKNEATDGVEAELAKHLDLIEKDFDKAWEDAEELPLNKVLVQKQTDVQSVVLSKDRFKTATAAKQWAREHGFKTSKIDEKANTFRFRQFEPSLCKAGTFRNKKITEGVVAVICVPKGSETPSGGLSKAEADKIKKAAKDFMGTIQAAVYKLTNSTYNFEESAGSMQRAVRTVRAIVVDKTASTEPDQEGHFNYLAAIGPVSQEQLAKYEKTAVIDDRTYAILGTTLGSSVKAEKGDILEIEAIGLQAEDGSKAAKLSWDEAKVLKARDDLSSPDSTSRIALLAAPLEKIYRETLEKRIKVFTDGDQHFVLGIMLEPETVDAQKEIYSAEEIESAAHGYLEAHRNIGYMHKELINDKVKLVESYVTRSDMEIDGQKVKKGTWLVGLLVLDQNIWKQIKSGELTGLSIGGSAIRIPEAA